MTGEGTRVVRAGLPDPVPGAPLLPGPTFAAPYHLPGDPAAAPYDYGRYDNPTWSAYERALGELEGGEAVVFASGMAAVAAVLLPSLRAGDVVVAPSDGYAVVRDFADAELSKRGVEVRLVPTTEAHDALDAAAVVWLETPTNPGLDVCDVQAIAGAARAAGALVAVDNTTATPLGQRPLELGADLSVASDSKGLTGHGDLIMGHVAAREPRLAARVRAWRDRTGAVPGPLETWLAHRSLATLEVRLERQCASALALSELLAARRDVGSVRYPGRPGDPAHNVAARQMRRFGAVVSFELEGADRAERFLRACELVYQATSFGGVHTTAERRARWGYGDAPEGLIRLSVGLEDADDLLADVAGALDATRPR